MHRNNNKITMLWKILWSFAALTREKRPCLPFVSLSSFSKMLLVYLMPAISRSFVWRLFFGIFALQESRQQAEHTKQEDACMHIYWDRFDFITTFYWSHSVHVGLFEDRRMSMPLNDQLFNSSAANAALPVQRVFRRRTQVASEDLKGNLTSESLTKGLFFIIDAVGLILFTKICFWPAEQKWMNFSLELWNHFHIAGQSR